MNADTIIITGAGGGLGSALSKATVQAGWNTVMLDCNTRALEEAYDRVQHPGSGEAALYPLDLAGAAPEDYETLLETTAAEFGGVDALVHCAVRFESLTPLEQFQPQEWLAHLQVNLNAAWLLSARTLPYLRDSGKGRMLFLLEDLDKVEGALWGAYGVSKHALKALVHQFHLECRTSGVEVRGVNPGPMSSALRARAYHSENPKTSPDPSIAAAEILAYLEGKRHWDEVLVTL